MTGLESHMPISLTVAVVHPKNYFRSAADDNKFRPFYGNKSKTKKWYYFFLQKNSIKFLHKYIRHEKEGIGE